MRNTGLSAAATQGGKRHGLRHFLLALQFFTRLPLPGRLAAWVGYSPEMMKAAAGHFPGVGWLVGSVAAVALWGALSLLGAGSVATVMAAVVLSVVASVGFTGAFHEDGLADVGDALGGCVSAEKALQIMKDSRLGSYGTMTMLLALLLKISLLSALVPLGIGTVMVALLAAHVLSRFAPLWLIRWLRYVGSTHSSASSASSGMAAGGVSAGEAAHAGAASAESVPSEAPNHSESPNEAARAEAQAVASKSRVLAEDISIRSLQTACLWVLPALLMLASVFGVGAMFAVLAAGAVLTWQMGRFFRRRIGGVTGDCLGATQQLNELCCYLLLVILTGVGH